MFGGKKKRKPADTSAPEAAGGASTLPASPPSTGPADDQAAVVLIIGGEEAFNRDVARHIADGARTVVFAETAAEAQPRARGNSVACIAMRILLPDGDARELFTRLREDPRTAAIPVLFLGERITDSIRQHSCRTEADGDMEGTPTAEAVAGWILSRLRRGREVGRDARRDPLTGLPSRAGFGEEYARIAAGCRQDQEPLAVALIAADPMPGGGKHSDDVLVRLASTLSNCLRATDVVARRGQDEFVALLPGEHDAGGLCAMEKVLDAWRQQGDVPPGPGAVTISVGLAVVDPSVPADQAILEAGRYLHGARIAGGNRVETSRSRLTHRRGRILLVIADKVMAKICLSLLTREDVRAVCVPEAAAAVEACSGRWRFQLIVIDEKLPGKDGLEVFAMLKELPRNQRVPVMIMLAAHSEAQVARAVALGASDYVVRPFDPLPFVSRMRELLAESMLTAADAPTTCRMLVVEEDMNSLILAGTTLHKYGGVEVCLCLNVEDARQRLREESIDVVLAPLRILEELATSAPGSPKVSTPESEPVRVAIAGEAETPTPEALKHAGCRGVLKRPLNPMTLGEEVMRLAGVEPGAVVPESHFAKELRRVVQRTRSV